MDVSHAQLSSPGVGQVLLTDPGFPWQVKVTVRSGAERPEVSSLEITSRSTAPITASVLAQIPLRQIAAVATSATLGEEETLYRMLAKPRPKGERSWPPEHFERVQRVARWARATGRPGGAAGAVAEFWAVRPRTARRWLKHGQ